MTEPSVTSDVLVELGAVDLVEQIRRREVSCVDVMTAYLDHIDQHNGSVNAIIALRDRPALLDEARQRDAELVRGICRPMHGIPQAVKDLAEVADLPFTMGSPIYKDRVGTVDELFVHRMREAGAIIIGKTNVPEFGYGSQTYNPVWGATTNPYDTTRTAGGSSGGAAAALALRMLPVADGGDYMGSLRNPAAFCNVLGLRPSRGRVPQTGFVAQMAEIGPMGRSVDDVALLLSVMAGSDTTAPLALTDDSNALRNVAAADLRNSRIAWVGDLQGRLATEPGVLDLCREATSVLSELGATVEEVTLGVDLDRLWNAFLTWRWWGATRRAELLDIPSNRALLKPEARWEIENGLGLSARQITEALTVRDDWFATVCRIFDDYDAIVAPSAQVFPFPASLPWPDEINGQPMDSYHRWMETVVPWSMAGVPVLGMPAGFDSRGLPTGIQLIGAPRRDLQVLEIGKAYEEATQWTTRIRPPALGAAAPR